MKSGKTALHVAAENDSEGLVKILIEHGSDIDLQTKVLIFFSIWGCGGGCWSGSFFFYNFLFLF